MLESFNAWSFNAIYLLLFSSSGHPYSWVYCSHCVDKELGVISNFEVDKVGIPPLQLESYGGAGQGSWNTTHSDVCSSAPPPCQGFLQALASTVRAGSPWAPFLLSNAHASKLTTFFLTFLSINPEKSVLRAGITGFPCSHNLLHLLSSAKTQLPLEKQKEDQFLCFLAFSKSFLSLAPEARDI